MKKSLIAGLSAIALATGGVAFAHSYGGGGMKADTDGNGQVSRAEAEAGAAARFARMDANNDGALTAADREARMTEHRSKMFTALDADKNGQISRDEFMTHKPEGMHAGMGHGGHKMGMHGSRGGGMMMGMADSNKDGSVSKAEFTTAALARFDRTDTDKNGQVSPEERKAMHDQMRETWRSMKHGGEAS